MAENLVSAVPDHAGGWRLIAALQRAAGDDRAAQAATAHELAAATNDPRLIRAGHALVANDIPQAEALLRQALRDNPADIAAIRMLAEVAGRIGRYRDAEALLRRAVELAPEFDAARHNLAIILFRQSRPADARVEVERLIARDPRDRAARNLLAAILSQLGEHDASIALYEEILAEHDGHPWLWLSHGHGLKTIGRTADAIDAYRRAVAIRPETGEAWWSLANLKTFRFSDTDVAAMRSALDSKALTPDDRAQLDFALGKAHEDRGEDGPAVDHYLAGNAMRRRMVPYQADNTTEHVDRSAPFFNAEFFATRKGWGCAARDPIFVLGMPRSGSTLIEQILSSHSEVGAPANWLILGLSPSD